MKDIAIEVKFYSGNNAYYIRIKKIVLYFSYETIVAFESDKPEILSSLTGYGRLVCSENVWSTTTGRHLNIIQPDKSKRIKYEIFKELLQDVLEKNNLVE